MPNYGENICKNAKIYLLRLFKHECQNLYVFGGHISKRDQDQVEPKIGPKFSITAVDLS